MFLLKPNSDKIKFLKIRKQKKSRLLKNTNRKLLAGVFGLQCIEFVKITPKQLEAARRAITRKIKANYKGKIWRRQYPNVPLTAKPLKTRMGKGTGKLDLWVCKLYPGQILFEIRGIPRQIAIEAFTAVQPRLPIKTKILFKTFSV